jgi:hypothetical protein
MIRWFLERRRAIRVFKQILTPQLRGDTTVEPHRHGRIGFVLAFVQGRTASEVSERMGRVADVATKYRATFFQSVSGLMILGFGTHADSLIDSQPLLVEALRTELTNNIKIVHGVGEADYGLFGNNTWPSFTFLLPQFDAILGVLARLPFGEAEEFRCEAAANIERSPSPRPSPPGEGEQSSAQMKK